MKDGDIALFLTLFERQAKRVSIEKSHWVSPFLALMPSEINQLMAREAEEKFDDYDYIKGLFSGASSSDGCFSNEGKSKISLNHHDRSAV
ncbi:hypothetical protein TNIN_355361 [Trichonephila inaurata madagascariensis]|uniref:Uncharacterized protein n=1 Tax=Trichonephila inaurata madagascariensis TaxID=2747483 RepID=A0A8X6MHB4_9ARAC|nr:hypothetical protein TNIN_398031 [Trichonephila inaurata madagascariensis]GFY69658.1 hypothetical protein TNIN_355361 [Trichonephila inaurata madagascariensis]